MLKWVEQEFKPHILEAPIHVVVLLLLDSYTCHKLMSWVSSAAYSRGTLKTSLETDGRHG